MSDDRPRGRIGAVELDDLNLIREPRLEESPQFQKIRERLKGSEEVFHALEGRGELQLDKLLTTALDQIASSSGLDGLMIASEDGFPVAQSAGISRSEVMAAITCLFQSTVNRAKQRRLGRYRAAYVCCSDGLAREPYTESGHQPGAVQRPGGAGGRTD